MDGTSYPIPLDAALALPHVIEGKFIRFCPQEPCKYMELVASNGAQLRLKLPKHERLRAMQTFKPGIKLRCIPRPKQEAKNPFPKLERIEIIGESELSYQPQTITLKVCQHKACAKKGALEICQSLSAAITPALTTHVVIQPVGCLKHCKQAPNLVISPTQAHHSRFTIAEIPGLLNSLGLDHVSV
ncbi:MAG: (2Fe-2S) ferredoxin domain-containing protein [Pseudanabaenaceae cyanobacterium bins.68]|nr:(2Fe-2S) ferredoxin domain-containing protein [Pseudanabaenaceae cyanobacterium bins.68]